MPEAVDPEQDSNNNDAKYHARGLFSSIRVMLHDRLSLRDLTEPEHTIDGIKKDVEFRGFNLWILIFSILICSIGLNANSGAVIVGAMLISPLMGPIMGFGLSIAINDTETLKKSLKSMITAIFVSVATSFVFFLFVPLGTDYSELLARTHPDIRDVFIGFFGGLTGILAGSRKEKTNVIPGVAIATALMPPLCTAGYGLATQNWSFFLGAFYLFLINSFFIALATMIVVRYLNFPVTKFLSKEKERKGRRLILIATLIIMIPSIAVFYLVLQETIFNREASTFVKEHVHYEGSEIIKDVIKYRRDSVSTIHLVMIGEKIPELTIKNWQKILDKDIGDTYLDIVQGKDEAIAAQAEVSKLIDMNENTRREAIEKDKTIYELQSQLDQLKGEQIPASFSREITAFYPEIDEISMGTIYTGTSDENLDTLTVVLIRWGEDKIEDVELKEKAVFNSMKARMNRDTIWVQSIYR